LLDVTFSDGGRTHFIKSRDRYQPISFCTDLGTLEPRALTGGGDLVGWISTSISRVGFSWDRHELTTVQYPGSPFTSLFSANSAGYVVGEAYLADQARFVSFVYVPHPAGER
jgi:hypothetical protein